LAAGNVVASVVGTTLTFTGGDDDDSVLVSGTNDGQWQYDPTDIL
jgi:hypothetical protein